MQHLEGIRGQGFGMGRRKGTVLSHSDGRGLNDDLQEARPSLYHPVQVVGRIFMRRGDKYNYFLMLEHYQSTLQSLPAKYYQRQHSSSAA